MWDRKTWHSDTGICERHVRKGADASPRHSRNGRAPPARPAVWPLCRPSPCRMRGGGAYPVAGARRTAIATVPLTG